MVSTSYGARFRRTLWKASPCKSAKYLAFNITLTACEVDMEERDEKEDVRTNPRQNPGFRVHHDSGDIHSLPRSDIKGQCQNSLDIVQPHLFSAQSPVSVLSRVTPAIMVSSGHCRSYLQQSRTLSLLFPLLPHTLFTLQLSSLAFFLSVCSLFYRVLKTGR